MRALRNGYVWGYAWGYVWGYVWPRRLCMIAWVSRDKLQAAPHGVQYMLNRKLEREKRVRAYTQRQSVTGSSYINGLENHLI